MKSAKTIFRQHLKEKGMLCSKQREQILTDFIKTRNHPTVDDIYDTIRRKNSKVGLATVYRTMRAICDCGLAEKVDFEDHKAYKAHVHYDLLKSVPVKATLTNANTSERQVLRENLEADRLYVLDRGYGSYQLMQDIIDADSSFVCRMPERYSREIQEDIELTPEAKEAGIISDQIVKLGVREISGIVKEPVRLIEVKCTERTLKSVRMGRKNGQQETTMLVVTNRVDLNADVIALIYHYRWQIEIFFRYFKHMLGCRHLLSYCDNGIEIQTYAGIIACLLIALYTGGKVTKRTFEMFCWYSMGWADDQEMAAHISKLKV